MCWPQVPSIKRTLYLDLHKTIAQLIWMEIYEEHFTRVYKQHTCRAQFVDVFVIKNILTLCKSIRMLSKNIIMLSKNVIMLGKSQRSIQLLTVSPLKEDLVYTHSEYLVCTHTVRS